jgi:hypothetical protein
MTRHLTEIIDYQPDDGRHWSDVLAEAIARQELAAEDRAARREAREWAKAEAIARRQLGLEPQPRQGTAPAGNAPATILAAPVPPPPAPSLAPSPRPWIDGRTRAGRAEAAMLRARGLERRP